MIRSRLSRRHARQRTTAPVLNLVSMIDVLSILMFFLLINSGQVPLLELVPELELPVAAADAAPDNYVVVSIDDGGVLVGKTRVLGLDELLAEGAAPGDVVPALRDALLAARAAHPVKPGDEAVKPVTILGDKQIPYTALKRVMASVQAAKFTEVQLAIDRPVPEAANGTAAQATTRIGVPVTGDAS